MSLPDMQSGLRPFIQNGGSRLNAQFATTTSILHMAHYYCQSAYGELLPAWYG